MESAANSLSLADHPRSTYAPADLRADLFNEVDRIVRSSPEVLANAELIPILAELALGPDGDPDMCREFVTGTLQSALKGIDGFGKLSGRELAKAIAELLGIGEKAWDNQNDRFDNAANELWTYTNGQSLRRTRRKHGDKTELIYKIFLGLLVAELVTWAEEINFLPAGRFVRKNLLGAHVSSQTPHTSAPKNLRTITATTLPRQKPLDIARLHRRVEYLAYELRRLLRGGFDGLGYRAEGFVLLNELATIVYPTGGKLLAKEKLEALLTWAINNRPRRNDFRGEIASREQEAIIIELIGMGKTRGQETPIVGKVGDSPPRQRYKRGLHYYRHLFHDDRWLEESHNLADELAALLCQLAIEEGIYIH
jgi:hypothetical protein